ncbi:MAG: hypothetical protein J7L43_03270 [Candidatus Aenigmarchaeota archaeon]|nr:hypothetical protein [Candidatus Aenigmarchaeota archaeon]
MDYYDLHIEVNDVDKVIELAKRLGYSGISIINIDKETAKSLSEKHEFDVISSKMIVVNSKDELKKELSESRTNYEILIVSGGTYEINRAACEDSRVDILAHPEKGRKDSGLDHICMKAAEENDVAIEINFSEILNSGHRSRTMAFIRNNIMLAEKYNTKIIITSGAKSIWNLRAPRDLASIGFLLGMELGKSIQSVSTIPEDIIRINREKLEGKRFGSVRIIGEKDGRQA